MHLASFSISQVCPSETQSFKFTTVGASQSKLIILSLWLYIHSLYGLPRFSALFTFSPADTTVACRERYFKHFINQHQKRLLTLWNLNIYIVLILEVINSVGNVGINILPQLYWWKNYSKLGFYSFVCLFSIYFC